MLKRFNEAFGIEDDIELERKRFVNRVNELVFKPLESQEAWRNWLLTSTCVELGVSVDDARGVAFSRRGTTETIVEDLTSRDFGKTLRVLCALHEVGDDGWLAKRVDLGVTKALSLATVDIGVTWQEGMFRPNGAGLLDAALVDDPLRWLRDYPEVKGLYGKALSDWAEGRPEDAVGTAYKALERLAALVTGDERTLDNNKAALLRGIRVSHHWGAVLSAFMQFAHDRGRHASRPLQELDPGEVEAYLYQAGLLIRLILQRWKRENTEGDAAAS